MMTGIEVGMPDFVEDDVGAVVVGATKMNAGIVWDVRVFVPVGCIEFGAGLANGVDVKVTVDTSGDPLRNGAPILVVLGAVDTEEESRPEDGPGTGRVVETGTADWVERIVVTADPWESVEPEVITKAEDGGDGDVVKIVDRYVMIDPEESVDTTADTKDTDDGADADAELDIATVDIDVVREPAEFVSTTLITDELAGAETVARDVVSEPRESVVVRVETDSDGERGVVKLVEDVVEPIESVFVTRLIVPLDGTEPSVDAPAVMRVTSEAVVRIVVPDSTPVAMEEVVITSTVVVDEAFEGASDGLVELPCDDNATAREEAMSDVLVTDAVEVSSEMVETNIDPD